MTPNIPKYVENLIGVLEESGYAAYCVGGAVRDIIMGLKPHDFDVATDCPPQRITEIFPRTVPTGIAHGTVTVITDEAPIEVTAFRTEDGYMDNRHPDSVKFIGNIEEDLRRRDFTVNAIAYNKEAGFVDPFFGKDDIKAEILRAVGNPAERFKEDALRIMRCFRFASVLDFSIEEITEKSAIEQLPLLKNISAERIYSELLKMLNGKNILRASPFFSAGGLKFLGIPKADISPLYKLPQIPNVRLAALMILSEADAENVLKGLRADRSTIDGVTKLCNMYSLPVPKSHPEIKRFMNKLGELFYSYAELSVLKNGNARELIAAANDIIEKKEPYRICDLKINGDDLKDIGICGKEIGNALQQLTEHVTDNPDDNKKETLLKLIK